VRVFTLPKRLSLLKTVSAITNWKNRIFFDLFLVTFGPRVQMPFFSVAGPTDFFVSLLLEFFFANFVQVHFVKSSPGRGPSRSRFALLPTNSQATLPFLTSKSFFRPFRPQMKNTLLLAASHQPCPPLREYLSPSLSSPLTRSRLFPNIHKSIFSI